MNFSFCVALFSLLSFNNALVSSQSNGESETGEITTLKSVHVIFRHGAKSPQRHWLKNVTEAGSPDWPQGWDQLTNKGKAQAYELGRYLRKRYDGFISKEYIPKEIYAQSSDKERTIQSAELVLLGLYEEKQNISSTQNSWNPEFPWELVPVHSIPGDVDRILQVNNCPKFIRETGKQVLMSCEGDSCPPITKTFYDENKPMFDMIAKYTGVPISDARVSYEAFLLQENIALLVEDGKNVTDWMVQLLEMKGFNQIPVAVYKAMESFPGWIELRTGPLWEQILSQLEKVTENAKMQLYSTHDVTLADLLASLNLWGADAKIPPFASALMIELHQTDTSDPFIQILYHNDSGAKPFVLEIPECKSPCTLSTFRSQVSKWIPAKENWEQRCLTTVGPRKNSFYFSSGMIILSILLGVLIISAIVGLYLECSDRNVRYSKTISGYTRLK